MTPPISIGSQVEITGPAEYGSIMHIGEKFEIAMKRAEGAAFGGRTLFSALGLPWYPANSLRLVEEDCHPLPYHCGAGTMCTDSEKCDEHPITTCPCYKGLKIGDYVEIIKSGNPWAGKIEKIIRCDGTDIPIQLEDKTWWRPTSLRKLTPDEINQHRTGDCRQALTKACIELNLPYNRPPMETIEAMLSMIAIDREDSKYGEVMERLSAIEKQVADIKKQMFEFRNLMMEIETRMDERVDEQQKSIDVVGREIKGRTFDKTPIAEILRRLDFIEAFQKDEAKHAAYTTYTYKPGEEGTITVHCSCGQKHEIEATPRAYGGRSA